MPRRDVTSGGGAGGGGQRHAAPVDNYRKQLGRHDSHEQRKLARSRMRSQGDKIDRKAAALSTGVWLLVSIPLVLGTIYLILYCLMTGDMQPWMTLYKKLREGME